MMTHGELTKWGWTVYYPDNMDMGANTDIGEGTTIFCHDKVFIGEGVQIGGKCSIYTRSTIDNTEGPVQIKKGASIGTHCIIMPGVTVGCDAKIGANSFVPTHTRIGDGET